MKINEVEKLIGITKKNIRFYEGEGLLSPGRNKENGYRNYDEDDINRLEQIKLFRKLGMPIEEIRSMQSGKSTVADSMRRHLVTLERQQKNVANSIAFCSELKAEEKSLNDLDAHTLLAQMDEMERKGVAFANINVTDIKRRRYFGAVIPSVVVVLVMAALFALMLWAFNAKPEEAPPLPLFIFLLLMPVIIILGVLYSLWQRIKEIKKGEIEDARRF